MSSANEQVFVKFTDPGGFDRSGEAERVARQATLLGELRRVPGVIDARPLFTRDPGVLVRELAELWNAGVRDLPDLTTWFRLRAESVAAAQTLLGPPNRLPAGVEVAYHPQDLGRPGVFAPWRGALIEAASRAGAGIRRITRSASARVRDLVTRPSDDLSLLQRYLLSAPWGIGAVDVAGWPALTAEAGRRLAVVDDWWDEAHEDLQGVEVKAQLGVVADRDMHGTQVLGILLARPNGFGMIGAAPGMVLVFSHPYTQAEGEGKLYGVADAIDRTFAELRGGDVLLVERKTGNRLVEVERDCFDVIRHAVARGIVVVEPAGNNQDDLDPILGPAHADSGAIVVGAGMEGSPQRPKARRRFINSNFGRRVDVQSHGYDVATIADGSAYTGNGRVGFGDTSAASAIVAGAAAVAACAAALIDPAGVGIDPPTLRAIMVRTGSPQPPANDGEHIGPQPNLPAMIREIRRELCRRHAIAVSPNGAGALSATERDFLRLVGAGLSDAGIARVLAPKDGGDAQRIASERARLLSRLHLEPASAALQAGAIADQLDAG